MTDAVDTMGHNSEAMDIKAMVREEPKAIYHDPKLLPQLLAKLDEEAKAAPTDMSDRKAREKLKSDAYAIATLKSSLSKAAKDLTADFRKRTDEVNEVRREIETALEQRQDSLRAPLTEWEEAEKAREEKVRAFRAYLEESLRVPNGVTIEQLARRRQKIEDTAIEPDVFGELVDHVRKERDAALSALDEAKVRIEQAERDRQELEELRLEKAKRAAEEKAERDRLAAEEEKRIEREAAERKRLEDIAAAEKAAAEKVRLEEQARQAKALAAAEEERRQADAKRQAEVDAAMEAQRKAEAEAQRLRDIAAAEAREKARLAEEERRRQADKAHRDSVMAMAASDISDACGIPISDAQTIVLAIAAGSISNVEMKF